MEVVEVKSDKSGVVMRMNNGTILAICPHENYIYFTLSGIEVPTWVNNDLNHLFNNTLCWNFEVLPC